MTQRHRPLDDRITEFERELSLMEQAYVESKRRMSGTDKEWEARKAALIRQMCELVGQFQIGDDATKAVAIVAQCAVMAAELRAPELWVSKYEERKEMLKMARSQKERQERATEAAREAYENQPWRRASNL
jgi:hypothetical protein